MKTRQHLPILLSCISLFSLLCAVIILENQSIPSTTNPSVVKANSETPVPSPLPEYIGTVLPEVSAHGVLALDIDKLAVLYEKGSNVQLFPASTTKLMTALVALDMYSLDQVVVVPSVKVDGQKMGLYGGEKVTIESLFYGMLVDSGNDAAEALSRLYPGGRDAFIAAMNAKAQALGLKNTVYKNPTGLDDPGQLTSAYDLVFLGIEVMRHPELARIVGTKEVNLEVLNGKHQFSNINELVGTVPGVIGVKTGWTEVAGENLLTEIERDGRHVMIAVLSSKDRFGETRTLIDWIYKSYLWK